MYYNIAVSTMVVKLQLKENIKHAIICTITHIKCVGQKPKKTTDIVLVKWLVSQGLSSGPAAPGPTDCW